MARKFLNRPQDEASEPTSAPDMPVQITRASLDPSGAIVPGVWIVPAIGKSRFSSRGHAYERAVQLMTQYGPGVYEARVVSQPSRSRPGETSWQVEIRSIGGMEGLVKYRER